MFSKRIFSLVLALSLLLIPLNAEAASSSVSAVNAPWFLQHVDWYEGAHVGANASIAHHPRSGKAFISYYDAVNTALKMAHEVTPGTGNCGQGNSWFCETVESGDNRGLGSSIAVTYVTTNPTILSYTKIGISYYDATKNRLRYAQCILHLTDSACTWEFNNVDDSSEEVIHIGMNSSLAFDEDAIAHIAYNYSEDWSSPTPDMSAVKFASYNGLGTGSCITDGSWDCEIVDLGYDSLEFGAECSLDFNLLGLPVITFYEAQTSALVMAIGNAGEGPKCESDSWNCITIDNSANVGRYSTLHARKTMDDTYMIAYYDGSNRKVKFAEYVETGGNCTSALFDCYAVDGTADVYPTNFDPISMDVDAQGYPVIAYMNSITETSPDYLMIARPSFIYGLNGNCGETHDGDIFPYWTCRTVDPPETSLNKGAFISIDVAPSGLVDIAYTEQDLQRSGLYLKVAQQRFATYLPIIKK